MDIIVKDWQDPETGQWFKSFGWKTRVGEDVYGDFLLDAESYKVFNKDVYMAHIEAILEQAEITEEYNLNNEKYQNKIKENNG